MGKNVLGRLTGLKGSVHEKCQLLTVRATNLNFLEFNGSVISLLYGYVEGHITLDDFSWTDPLRTDHSREEIKLAIFNSLRLNNLLS